MVDRVRIITVIFTLSHLGTRVLRPLLVILVALNGVAYAADITLSVQPANPIVNESFRLLFSTDSPVDAEPDFAEIELVVDILQRNRQSSIEWINGRNSHTTTWILNVIAKAAGDLSIPAVAFGSDRSRATVVQVHRSGGGQVPIDDGLLLEIEVDNETPYVQEQIILTARFLRRVEINNANLTEPSMDADAIIKRLGTDATYQARRNGKRYEVFERRYSIFLQTSGEVTVHPLTLTTKIMGASRSVFDPFRQSVKMRRIESGTISLRVKPIPPSYTGDTWLPAKRLRLHDDWSPNVAAVESGEPLMRTVSLWADGLNAGQLPELPIALPGGVKSYPDQPRTSEQATDNGFSAVRQQKYAIIANDAAELVFPATSITWWNTDTDQMEVARLDERRFTVQSPPPADTTSSSGTFPDTTRLQFPPAPSSPSIDVGTSMPVGASPDRLLIIAVVCLLGWIGTALAWWIRSRRTAQHDTSSTSDAPPPALSRARSDVLGACKANDPTGTKQAMVAWGRVAFDDSRLRTLREVVKRVGDPLDEEIRRLDEYLYGNSTGSWDPNALRDAFEHIEIHPPKSAELQRNANPLPDLFRLTGH